MSWQCGAAQPILMDEGVVRRAVDEQTPRDQAGRITRAEGVLFKEVLTIRLDFKYILKIDNLWDFTSLTRLYLNNNFIKKIAGVDHLVNLKWLNLSFNRIEKIEGLASLRKLELLNLSNNRISVIENIDQLGALTHFGIANNLLEQLDNVLCLREIQKLFTLNLSGNPLSKEEDYSLFIAAFFPNLRCLDYRLISEETKKEASIKYFGAIEKIRQEQMQKQQADDAEQSQRAELQLHRDAFVEFLNGSDLFKSMFKDDPEAETLQSVTGVADLLKTFEQEMVELCEQVFEIGLAEHKQREAEVNSFLSGRTKIVTDHQKKASQILVEFEERHHGRTWELQHLSDQDTLQVKVGHCNDAINQLSAALMSLELRLHKQVEDIIKELDINISDMVGSFTETVQGIFAQCRDLEDNYHRNVGDIALATLDKVASGSVIKDMSGDARWLFTNRNMVMDALATAHDNHLMKINDKETQMVAGVSAWKVSLIKGIQNKELKQNPATLRYIEYLWEQMEEFQLQDL
ncbi:dynein regulatory complex subunit 3-like [Platichthys flesus]|uniref:dynein regulatory complex subunit 3-like n=1 Tax=Platichthys flesus TaxID=8260 RepID=UPI002DBA72F2|nr:dynein regulatory complex subunit 3-like [Platichthys flesus]